MSKTEKKYTLFMDTILNKVDVKGRVSVPADYRALLEQKKTELTAFPSFKLPCIECFTSEMMEKIANEMEASFNPFSEEEDDFSNSIFAQAKEFSFDSTGRITLTEKLLSHAKITDQALFVGKGKTFQIWNPRIYEEQNKKRQLRISQQQFNIKRES